MEQDINESWQAFFDPLTRFLYGEKMVVAREFHTASEKY
jgi:hypothetical protein